MAISNAPVRGRIRALCFQLGLLLTLFTCHVLVRLFGLPRILTQLTHVEPHPHPSFDPHLLHDALARCSTLCPTWCTCLESATIAYRSAARHGQMPTLFIGAKRFHLALHAWVTINGSIWVGDTGDVHLYTPLLTVSHSSGIRPAGSLSSHPL